MAAVAEEAKITDEEQQAVAALKPHSDFVNPLLTDLYQITMTYAYWKNESPNQNAVFDLFFRKCPFKGEYAVFAGLDDVIRFLNTFKFSDTQLSELKATFPDWDLEFWEFLRGVDASKLKVHSMVEGTVVFPRVPLLRIEGPLAVCQLIETTLLNLINFATLVATNAARMRVAVGDSASLLEFGLRRAQGPDGGMSASRYAYVGGFDGTSNVLAGVTFGIPIKGTHAHSFVTSYQSLDQCSYSNPKIKCSEGTFLERVLYYRGQLGGESTNEGELAAFVAYANAFPAGFLGLVDTYDTLESGVINFMAVAMALDEAGFRAIGIRLDSGDLAYLSIMTRKYFKECATKFEKAYIADLTIVASNDIHEEVLYSLKEQKHCIDSFGIGTHLVTCKKQPALGGVYKLVSIEGTPRIKLSQETVKMTIPGKKEAYRLFNADGEALADLLVLSKESEQTRDELMKKHSLLEVSKPVRCFHPASDLKRVDIVPSRIQQLLIPVWDGKPVYKLPTLKEVRSYAMEQVRSLRSDYKRTEFPTPYKVSISHDLRTCLKQLIEREIPVKTIS